MGCLRRSTPESERGFGFVDVTTPQLIDKIDFEVIAVNAVTSCSRKDTRLPLTLPIEGETVATALTTLRSAPLAGRRIVHIRNTLALDRLPVLEGCPSLLREPPSVDVAGKPSLLAFDRRGHLLSPLTGYRPVRGRIPGDLASAWRGAAHWAWRRECRRRAD